MTIQDIYQKLNLLGKDALVLVSNDGKWIEQTAFPSRIYRLFENNKTLSELKGFFHFDGKPLILFYENPSDLKALHKAVWNLNESPILIIVSGGDVSICNAFAIDSNTQLLKELGGAEKLSDFTYLELVTGKCWEKYQHDLADKNRVDYHLLDNIQAAQKTLCVKQGLSRELSNALLGKMIFVRYLIDRNVRIFGTSLSNDDFCKILENKKTTWEFFEKLQSKEQGFNGDMFKLSKEDFAGISQEALNVLIQLLRGSDIATGQQSLFQLYDFSILPIEFISNVYERFIGKENQRKKGAYYTPTFIVDYIVAKTVGERLASTPQSTACKILDPACGSGIFLVESLRRMIDQYIKVNSVKRGERNTPEYLDALKEIAKENLFGIDSDASAIQVAIFSVYLTLLDYQEPADIEKFKFPNMLGDNFVCADAFDTENEELKSLVARKMPFDYILGNPPWNRGKIEKDEEGKRVEARYVKYIREREKKEDVEDIVCNNEIAQAFVLRSMDFATPQTKMALVITSKALYNKNSLGFRKYILNNLFIDRVFEMASERRTIFTTSMGGAIAPPCILFYHLANGESTDNNIIEHISLKPSRLFQLFRLFGLSKNDIQEIQQNRLKMDDRLWKILVYGSYLDYNFISRLDRLSSIQKVLEDGKYFMKQGIKEKDGEKAFDVTDIIGWNYIKTEHVRKGFIAQADETWKVNPVGYVYRERGKIATHIYKAPMLLVTGGTSLDLKAVSAVSQKDGVYKSSLTGVHIYGENVIARLRAISCILNSSLFAYYNLMTFASSGIEREEAHDEERFMLPYCYSDEIVEKAIELEDKLACYNSDIMQKPSLQGEIEELYKRIDDLIKESLDCSHQEKALMDYVNNIMIPLIIRHENMLVSYPLSGNDEMLREYVQVFLDKFGSNFNRNAHHFIAEIHCASLYIGVFFRVVAENDYVEEFKQVNDGDVNDLFPFFAKMSSKAETDQLFVQKDVRGFEKDGFYIVKPNERRLWHPAIAYKDANEFADSMLRSRRN